MLVSILLLSTLLLDLAKPASIVYNTSSICTSPQACYFNDPDIWMGGVAPEGADDVVVRGGGKAKKIELFINSTVSVKSVTLSSNALLNVRQFGVLNATSISWKAPSTIQVDAGRLHAIAGVWSETPGSNVNNGSLIVTNGGRFMLGQSTEVGNVSISNGSIVQMINFKVFDSLNISDSHINVRFIDGANIFTNGTNVTTSSLFVGQSAYFFSGRLDTDYLSSFSSTQIQFINVTASIADLEVGTLSITSSNLTLTPSHDLLSLNVTNSTVTFVSTDDSSDETDDESSAAQGRRDALAANGTVTFANVFLAHANIVLLTSNVNFCKLQINSNSTINGSVQVTCGISFTSPYLVINGNYTQSASTYMNISTTENFANYTFLRVHGQIDILGTEIYKDISTPGVNSTIRLALSWPNQLNAQVGVIHDPFLAVGFVDVVTIDEAKGHMFLTLEKPKAPKQVYFYEDWRYITAAVLLTLLAVGTFALAKYLRRTRELDERLLEDGDKDKRGDSSDEEEDEEEEEIDGMGDKRLIRVE